MAVLTTQKIVPAGKVVTYASAAPGGDKIKPGERTFIHVKNGGGGSVTVTVNDTKTARPEGAVAFDPDLAVEIAPGSEKFIGPIRSDRFAGGDGNASIAYSGTTSVTVAAIGV
jgi:hypothetical protein